MGGKENVCIFDQLNKIIARMNISNWFKKNKWYLALLPLLFLFDFIYFLPFFQGKDLDQFDAKQWRGSAQEIIEYREKTGENNFLWTNSMFCGIPSYQVTSPEVY